MLPVTHNLLLTGRSNQGTHPGVARPVLAVQEVRYPERLEYMREVSRTWWELWRTQCLADLLPLNRWRERCRHLQDGHICLMKYDKKFGEDPY